MPGKNTGRILVLNSTEYFHGVVSGAVSALRLEVSEHAQHYLVQLLGHFIHSENLYPTDAEGKPLETLTHQLATALEEEKVEERANRLRKMGDYSLYVAGFFSDSLNRKLVDVDYYIGMGEAAYENVARLEDKRPKADLFYELAKKFPRFVDVLSQISEESGFNPNSHQDLLRVYDQWLKTGSKKFANQLVKAGIAPTDPKLKKTGSDDS